MELICATCSQPNPTGAKLCSRCSSIFPALTVDALSATESSAPPASSTAAETLIDVARRPEGIASETLPASAGTTSATETLVAAAATGGETLIATPSSGGETIVAPSDPAPARTPPPRSASRDRTPSNPRLDAAAVAAGSLQPGDHLGTRYEIVKLLGKGGMGAVYLARDLDLGRDVAMKLIAPHLANDTGVLERFKREIQLSSIVTHQNVLRVYDLGEADGVKFLTMQFIEGETLADLIARERPLPLEKTLSFFKQICEALAAAHEKGVLHRDLKPQNVMLDAEGHVYLMDFGLATSRAVTAMTQVGAIMGTPQYMSPEQVKGTQTDARSDIFSLGVMLYEMLSGELPFNGDSLFEIMIKRTQGPPRSIVELNPNVPVYLRQLLDRCLAVDPVLRYHEMGELLFDLDAGSVLAPLKRRRGPSRKTILIGSALVSAVVAGSVATTIARRSGPQENVAAKPVTVLVADFDNRTGEDVLNGTLEPALATALENASFITLYSHGNAQKLADKLKLEGSGLSEKRARLVAQREGIGVVMTGYVEREGSGYRVGVRAVDAFTGQRILEQQDVVGGRDAVLTSVSRLAARVRGKLGDQTPESVQMKEAETYSAGSLEAAHEYGLGSSLAIQGKFDEAAAHYLASLKLDPNLGRAYTGLAVIELNRARSAEAEKYFSQMLARVDRMTQREKYRALGSYYVFTKDTDKAIEAYSALVKDYPADSAGLSMLSVVYAQKRDMKMAFEMARRASDVYPNDAMARNNVGFAALFLGDHETSIAEQKKVLEASPSFMNGYIGLALAYLAGGQRDLAVETWRRLQDVPGGSTSMAVEGLADVASYEGRLGDARKMLEAGVAIDVGKGDTDAAARKLTNLAEVYLALHSPTQARAAARRMLQLTNMDYIALVAGTVLAATGDAKGALAVASDLDVRIGAEARMEAELVRGAVELAARNHAEAITRFRNAVQRLDSWVARLALARAYFAAGAYPAALDEFEMCEKRHGEATDAFQDTFPTFRMYPAVRYYLGRTHEALKSPAAAEKYQAFLALKKSDEDPMVKDARKRLAALGGAPPVVPAAAQK